MRTDKNTKTRLIRLVASVTLACFSATLFGVAPPLALVGIVIGLAAAGYQGLQMWRERRDPYDLSRLWDTPLNSAELDKAEEPEEDGKTRTLALCHRCGASMSTRYSICPHCGVPLGH